MSTVRGEQKKGALFPNRWTKDKEVQFWKGRCEEIAQELKKEIKEHQTTAGQLQNAKTQLMLWKAAQK